MIDDNVSPDDLEIFSKKFNIPYHPIKYFYGVNIFYFYLLKTNINIMYQKILFIQYREWMIVTYATTIP